MYELQFDNGTSVEEADDDIRIRPYEVALASYNPDRYDALQESYFCDVQLFDIKTSRMHNFKQVFTVAQLLALCPHVVYTETLSKTRDSIRLRLQERNGITPTEHSPI